MPDTRPCTCGALYERKTTMLSLPDIGSFDCRDCGDDYRLPLFRKLTDGQPKPLK
jgi:hypothetical protein